MSNAGTSKVILEGTIKEQSAGMEMILARPKRKPCSEKYLGEIKS